MEHQEMVIPIHPRIEAEVSCLKCESQTVDIHDYLFTGIHVLIDCTCMNCSTRFFHTLAVSHDGLWPIAFNRSMSRYDNKVKTWSAIPLITAVLNDDRINPRIIKKNISPLKDHVVVLNCLDSCFGHSYIKMLNAQTRPDRSLIMVITQNLEWMVPEGVDELWIVEAPMREMKKMVRGLQDFVKAELKNIARCDLFAAKVFLDLPNIDVEPFLKTKPFDSSKVDTNLKTVTFIVRDDRFWHGNKPEELLYLALKKYKISFNGYFKWRQRRLIEKTMAKLDGIRVNIITAENMTPELEKQYCDVYSESHLVIGVHGSNMLIPTSLSGGFIDIVPFYKQDHLGEDTVVRNPGKSQYAAQFITPAALASLIKKFL